MNTRTVRRGLAKLAQEGVIEKRPRAGNFVRSARCRESINTVAVAFPESMRRDNEFHPQAVGAVLTAASRVFNQRDTTLSTYWYAAERFWLDAGQLIAESGARGVLLWPHGSLVRSDIDRLQKADIRVALLGQPSCAFFDELQIGGTQVDRVSGFVQVMDRLMAAGHTRIAVAMHERSPAREEFREAVAEYRRMHPQLGAMRDFFVEIPNRDRLDMRILAVVLERSPRPTALLVPDEVVACEAFRLCYRAGLRVPDDISLASITATIPSVHPVRLVAAYGPWMLEQLGGRAAKYLKDVLDGELVDHAGIVISCQIQEGESIGPPPDSDISVHAQFSTDHDLLSEGTKT